MPKYLDLLPTTKQEKERQELEKRRMPQRRSYLDMLPEGAQRSSTPLEQATRLSSKSYLEMLDAPKVKPKDVQAKPDAIVKIEDPPKEMPQWNDLGELIDQTYNTEKRDKAKRIRGMFGDGVARVLYGDEIVDQLPDRPVPNSYKDAYIKDGEWYIPGRGKVEPPPESFMEGVPEMSWAEKGMEFLLPEAVSHLGDTLHTIITGPHYEREQAMQNFTTSLAELPFWTQQGWQAAMKGLGWFLKKGLYPPRLIMKGLAHADNKLLLPIREKVWEVVSFPIKKRIIPTYEGAKSFKEIFQPAIERMAPDIQRPFREAAAQKQLLARAGQKLGTRVREFSHAERYEFAKAMRGERSSNPKIQGVVDEFKAKIGSYKLGSQYKEHFFQELEKQMKKLEFGYGLDESFPAVEEMMQLVAGKGRVKSTVRQVQRSLAKLIEHPFAPDDVKVLARDLYNLPAATPEAVAAAAKHASKQKIVDAVKNSPYAKIALGAGDNPKDWMQTQFKGKGMKGLWVQRDVELELRALQDIPKIAQKNFAKWFMTPWKTGKIILRPATHFRNIVSNTILNDWGGLSFYRVDVYAKALREMARKGKTWKEFQRLTGAGGTFSTAEASQLEKGLRYGSNMFDNALGIFDRVVAPARNWYNAEEQLFKLAKYIHNLDKGLGTREAALDAMKWTFNYNEVTRATAFVRGHLAPFFTWQSKVIPLMSEVAVQNPWRLGKWWVMYELLQNHALQEVGMNDHEWDLFEKILPEYIQEGQFLLLPWRDDEDRLQLLNLTYMIPGFGDLSELAAHPAGELLGNPLYTMAGTLLTKTKWSGAPLYYDWEQPGTKASKVFSYVWEQLMPPIAPGGVDWNKMWETLSEQEGAPTLEQQMASNLGFKIVPIDEAKARRSRRVLDDIHRAEVGSQLRRELRKAKTPRQRSEVIEKYSRLRREIGLD